MEVIFVESNIDVQWSYSPDDLLVNEDCLLARWISLANLINFLQALASDARAKEAKIAELEAKLESSDGRLAAVKDVQVGWSALAHRNQCDPSLNP